MPGRNGRGRLGRLLNVAWVAAADLDQRHWRAAGEAIAKLDSASNWWIGNWVRYGNGHYGNKYEIAARITGYGTKTLTNMASIAAHYEIDRRRPHITWSHHSQLAPLPPAERDQWLDRLEREPMSVRSLREELKRLGVSPKTRNGAPIDAEPSGAVGDAAPPPALCPYCGRPLPAGDAFSRSRPRSRRRGVCEVPPATNSVAHPQS